METSDEVIYDRIKYSTFEYQKSNEEYHHGILRYYSDPFHFPVKSHVKSHVKSIGLFLESVKEKDLLLSHSQ